MLDGFAQAGALHNIARNIGYHLALRKFGNVGFDPETEAIATIGAKEGLAHLLWVLVEPGADCHDARRRLRELSEELTGIHSAA